MPTIPPVSWCWAHRRPPIAPTCSISRTSSIIELDQTREHILVRVSDLGCGFDQEGDLEVCETVESGEVALQRIEEVTPDLVLVDLSLGGISGLDLIKSIKMRYPALKCAILSGHGERRYVDQAFEAGAEGYILKGDPAEVPDSIRQMMQGRRYVSKTL